MTGTIHVDPEQLVLGQTIVHEASGEVARAAGRLDAVLTEVGVGSSLPDQLRSLADRGWQLEDRMARARFSALSSDRFAFASVMVGGTSVCLPSPYLGAAPPVERSFVDRVLDGLTYAVVETFETGRDLLPFISTHEGGAFGMWRDLGGGLLDLATSPSQWLPALLDLETLREEGFGFWVGSLAAAVPAGGAGRATGAARAGRGRGRAGGDGGGSPRRRNTEQPGQPLRGAPVRLSDPPPGLEALADITFTRGRRSDVLTFGDQTSLSRLADRLTHGKPVALSPEGYRYPTVQVGPDHSIGIRRSRGHGLTIDFFPPLVGPEDTLIRKLHVAD